MADHFATTVMQVVATVSEGTFIRIVSTDRSVAESELLPAAQFYPFPSTYVLQYVIQ
jgi:hypothetical protein